jgi:hypothetical protein
MAQELPGKGRRRYILTAAAFTYFQNNTAFAVQFKLDPCIPKAVKATGDDSVTFQLRSC